MNATRFPLLLSFLLLSACMPPVPSSLTLTSSAFVDGGSLPQKYTCEGAGISPPLTFGSPPGGTKAYALTVYDPDVPKELKPDGFFSHWVVFNIPAEVTTLPEGATIGTPGSNGAGKPGYTPPCPPADYEPKEHRYIFTLYALKDILDLPAGATREQVEAAAADLVLEKTVLTGRYQKVGG